MKPRTGLVAMLAAIGALGMPGTAFALSPPITIPITPAGDAVPPVVPVPAATLDENTRTVTLSAPSTDARSGIASYVWTAGDGTPPQVTTSSQFVHVYPSLGTFSGTVTVTDGAGNAASQGFTVAVVDHTAPRLAALQITQSVLTTRTLRVALAPSERTDATIAANVRVAGRTYRLTTAKRALFAGRSRTIRIAVPRAARQAIARALRRDLPVRARVSVALADRAGNAAVAAASARIVR
jgi:hypothetical protein